MSDLVQLEMTQDEARETDRLIKRHINTTRYLLLDMRDRKGWKALGYESFKEYGEKELGYQENYIHKLVNAAEISLQIGFDSDCTIVQPPESQLRPLKSVPEAERKAIWEEATRKAQEEGAKRTAKLVEKEVSEWKQRAQESQAESNERRRKIRELEEKLELSKKAEIQIVEKVPDDYEKLKSKAAELEALTGKLQNEVSSIKNKQDRIISDGVKHGMQSRQAELDELEARAASLNRIIEEKMKHYDSMNSEDKIDEIHQQVIQGVRVELINLGVFLNDVDPISNKNTIKKWRLLSGMLNDAHIAVDQVFGDNSHLIEYSE